MLTDKEKNEASYIEAKQDELHYLKQIVKYITHLQHIYYVGRLENKLKAKQIESSLESYKIEMDWVDKEIKELLKGGYETQNYCKRLL
jgi:hypothetical protein